MQRLKVASRGDRAQDVINMAPLHEDQRESRVLQIVRHYRITRARVTPGRRFGVTGRCKLPGRNKRKLELGIGNTRRP